MPKTDDEVMVMTPAARRRYRVEQRDLAMRRCELFAVAVDIHGNRRNWTPAEMQARYRARQKKSRITSFVETRRDMSRQTVEKARARWQAEHGASHPLPAADVPVASAGTPEPMPITADQAPSSFGQPAPSLGDLFASLTSELAALAPEK